MAHRILQILLLTFGTTFGVRVETRSLPVLRCGEWTPGVIVVEANVEEKCPTAVPGIDTLTWVVVHEGCHQWLHLQGYVGEPPLIDGQLNPHGLRFWACMYQHYPWPQVVELY